LKKESEQVTGSFKWRGVLFSVLNTFENLKNENINIKEPYYMVTQSTGNHGIAVIRAIHVVKKYYSEKYPEQKEKWSIIYPGIFTNKIIKQIKLDKMNNELSLYEKNHKGFVDSISNNYTEALKKRIIFLLHNQGIYMSHGGKDIMTGYGSLAYEIMTQIPPNKSFTMISAIGAGGPIGFAAYFAHFENCELIISQTNKFNAFVRSLESGRIEYNDCEQLPGLSEGIAVDKPEQYAFEIAQQLKVKAISVDEKDVEAIHNQIKLGGSSCIAFTVLKEIDITSDMIIILDCEGNK
jgi:threonine dehydratase